MPEFNETISIRHFVELMCADDRPSIDCLREGDLGSEFNIREWKADAVQVQY